jgi:hypothetical protein
MISNYFDYILRQGPAPAPPRSTNRDLVGRSPVRAVEPLEGRRLARELCRDFRAYAPARITEASAALRDRNAPRLREAAHKLGGLLSVYTHEEAIARAPGTDLPVSHAARELARRIRDGLNR